MTGVVETPLNGSENVLDEKLCRMIESVKRIIIGLGEDITREGLIDTPKRVSKALLECTLGYKQLISSSLSKAIFNEPIVYAGGNGIVIVRDIDFASVNEENFLPFHGRCHVGYVPSEGRVLGLSKMARLVRQFSKRLQNQNRLAQDLASALLDNFHCQGCAIVVQATHLSHLTVPQKRLSVCTAGCFSSQPSAYLEDLFCSLGLEDVPAKLIFDAGDSSYTNSSSKNPSIPVINESFFLNAGANETRSPSVSDSSSFPSSPDALSETGSSSSSSYMSYSASDHIDMSPNNDVVNAALSRRDLEIAVNNLISELGEDSSRPGLRNCAQAYVSSLLCSTSGYQRNLCMCSPSLASQNGDESNRLPNAVSSSTSEASTSHCLETVSGVNNTVKHSNRVSHPTGTAITKSAIVSHHRVVTPTEDEKAATAAATSAGGPPLKRSRYTFLWTPTVPLASVMATTAGNALENRERDDLITSAASSAGLAMSSRERSPHNPKHSRARGSLLSKNALKSGGEDSESAACQIEGSWTFLASSSSSSSLSSSSSSSPSSSSFSSSSSSSSRASSAASSPLRAVIPSSSLSPSLLPCCISSSLSASTADRVLATPLRSYSPVTMEVETVFVPFVSQCEHHMLPFYGTVMIAVGRTVGRDRAEEGREEGREEEEESTAAAVHENLLSTNMEDSNKAGNADDNGTVMVNGTVVSNDTVVVSGSNYDGNDGKVGTLLSNEAALRIVSVLTRRLQVQERITHQVADAVTEELAIASSPSSPSSSSSSSSPPSSSPFWVMVSCEAAHMCMVARGIESHSGFTLTYATRNDDALRKALTEEVFRGVEVGGVKEGSGEVGTDGKEMAMAAAAAALKAQILRQFRKTVKNGAIHSKKGARKIF